MQQLISSTEAQIIYTMILLYDTSSSLTINHTRQLNYRILHYISNINGGSKSGLIQINPHTT
jgi:hypothetical protein